MEETHCWCKEIKGSPTSRAVRQFQLCPSSLQGTTAWKLEYSDHVSSAAADHVDELGRYWLYEMLMIGKLYAIRKSLNINYVLDLPWKKTPKENNANIRHIRMNSKPDETYSFVLKAKLYHHQFYLKHIITCWLLWALWFFFSQSHKQFSATSKNPLEIQMLSAAENRSRCTSLGINLFIFTSGWVQNERGECRSGWKEHHGFWCFPALIHWL